tara:strand:- start:26770 stop:27477 length:708 start_codon:yes stop_codon:yes gene_type:complete
MNHLSKITLLFLVIVSCTSNSNDAEFLKKVEGRYLYSDDEVVVVHSDENKLLLNWRGAEGIRPLKTGNNTYFVKEMNQKIQFLTNPADQKMYLVFVPKNPDEALVYEHVKMNDTTKLPYEYLEAGNYEKALEGYLAIQQKDSLSPIINERKLNSKGYDYIQSQNLELAIVVFKINVALHPKSSNVYDSLAEAYFRKKDTVNAVINYTKVLEINSESRTAKNQLEKLQKKQVGKSN